MPNDSAPDHPARDDDQVIDVPTRDLVVRIDGSSDPIAGILESPGAAPLVFEGWLDLATVLDEARERIRRD